jgi:alpha-galactosidase
MIVHIIRMTHHIAEYTHHIAAIRRYPMGLKRQIGVLTLPIVDCWNCTTSWGGMGWPLILDKQLGLEVHAGPGHWNDPDMLQVGNDSLTLSESRAHFSLWGLLAAPLIAGNDLRAMSDDISDILTNEEVIAIDQDALGRQGYKIRDDGDLEVWVRQLHDGSRAVVLFNRGETKQDMTVNWTEIGYTSEMTVAARDLWQKEDLGSFTGHFTASVPSHDVIMVRITP